MPKSEIIKPPTIKLLPEEEEVQKLCGWIMNIHEALGLGPAEWWVEAASINPIGYKGRLNVARENVADFMYILDGEELQAVEDHTTGLKAWWDANKNDYENGLWEDYDKTVRETSLSNYGCGQVICSSTTAAVKLESDREAFLRTGQYRKGRTLAEQDAEISCSEYKGARVADEL